MTVKGDFKASIEEQLEIIELYKSGLSQQQICDKYNGCFARRSIGNILKHYHIEARNRNYNKDYFNENYFEIIDNQNKAYFIGLLLADGNISERYGSEPTIGIELNNRDKYIIERFKEELKSKNKVSDTAKNCISFRITSQKMANDLSQYYIIPNKTFKTQLPILEEKYMSHLIRGIFDGDGWVSGYLSKSGKTPFGFCGTELLVTQIRDYLSDKINIHKAKIGLYEGKVPQIIYNSINDIKTFYNYLYQDAELYLTRKKDKFII